MGKDRGSGLRENRLGLNRLRLPVMVSGGDVTVTCKNRQARFGLGRTRRLFAVRGVPLEVPHPKKPGGRDEPREDFGSLVTTFAGRLYRMRSSRARERLLAETAQGVEDCVE